MTHGRIRGRVWYQAVGPPRREDSCTEYGVDQTGRSVMTHESLIVIILTDN